MFLISAISNSLDLTERELPKLKLSKPPIVLPFSPYSKEDLQRILKNKLSSVCCTLILYLMGEIISFLEIELSITINNLQTL